MRRWYRYAVIALMALTWATVAHPAHGVSLKKRCRLACRGVIADCFAGGQRLRACKRSTLRSCRKDGLEVCVGTTSTTGATTTTVLASTTTTTVAVGPSVGIVVHSVTRDPTNEYLEANYVALDVSL